jgi:hypothetical protein
MVSLRRTLLAVVVGSAMLSRAAVAQRGSSSSLTHTVMVTVPPRLKVQVAAVAPSAAPAIPAPSVNASTQGLSLSVSATRPWVLSVGSNISSTGSGRWSLNPNSGFSVLTSNQVSIASGAISTGPTIATVFFRNIAAASSAQERDDNGTPVVLTISAP